MRFSSDPGQCCRLSAGIGSVGRILDHILAIQVLEHLHNLPATVREIHRMCEKALGTLHDMIPGEGRLDRSLRRRVSAQRILEKYYKQPYKWFIEREHLSKPEEIREELRPYFKIAPQTFFLLHLPIVFCIFV
jgi:hypothetical protein